MEALESRKIESQLFGLSKRNFNLKVSPLSSYRSRNSLVSSIFVIFSIIISLTSIVRCQDLEDLNKQSASIGFNTNQQQPPTLLTLQNSFQPLSRQPQSISNSVSSSNNGIAGTRQRPALTNRFTGSPQTAQQLLPQATNSAPLVAASAQQTMSAVPSGNSGSTTNNIEQLMKNALARTAQMNAAAAVVSESRQDVSEAMPANNNQPEPMSPISRSGIAVASTQSVGSSSFSDKQTDETASTTSEPEDFNKQTTLAQTSPASAHDTVYSDQRFASLFARRNSAKKSKINPTEQVKAKPTLPSFIKSPPDPKQFSATQSIAIQDRQVTPASNAFASQRLQQQNQNRVNLANQQQQQQKSRGVITSNSAAAANAKRVASSSGAKPATSGLTTNNTGALNQKLSSSKLSSTTSKPAASGPLSNNPFNRNQANNNDPANVIAMARKRLLANNALDKLKQQPKLVSTN